MNKKELRKKYIQLRNIIQDKDIKSHIIYNKIIEDEEYKKSNVIALYKSLKSEVDTKELIEYSLDIGKIVLLPRVNKEKLEFYRINKDSILIKNKFGVEEPNTNEQIYNINDINLIIVPGICFDLKRNRIGFGKGYYDRVLENANSIGIAFDEQIVEKQTIDIEEHDKKVKKIITDKRIV